MNGLERIEVEILFENPDDVGPAIAALIAQGFAIELLPDRVDECGPTVWIMARVYAAWDDEHLFEWLNGIVASLGKFCFEWGLEGHPASPKGWH